MITVLMRRDSDCEIAALATATGKTYEEVLKAEGRFELPGRLNDPVWGNPLTLYATLAKLGLWKRNITWEDLLYRRATPGKTIILIHALDNPLFAQHYIVLAAYSDDGFLCYWGYPVNPGVDANIPVNVKVNQMKDLILGGWPNCMFEVIRDTWWARFKRWLGRE